MISYDHNTFTLEMATRLRMIQHTSDHPRHFLVNGAEDLSSLDERLLSVSGPVLIAIDSSEFETSANGADFKMDAVSYAIIIASPVTKTDQHTIEIAVKNSTAALLQVRNVLIQRYGNLVHGFHFMPTGLIGDSFHGESMDFVFDSMGSYAPDSSFFLEP